MAIVGSVVARNEQGEKLGFLPVDAPYMPEVRLELQIVTEVNVIKCALCTFW